MLRRFAQLIAATAILGMIACNGNRQPKGADNHSDQSSPAEGAGDADIGPLLYGTKAPVTRQLPSPDGRIAAAPIVIPDCRLAVIEKEDVPCERDGVLSSVFVKEGDQVKAGQLLAQMKDQLARDDLAIQMAKMIASQADVQAAEATRDEAKARWVRQQKLERTTATSKEDLDAARAIYYRYYFEAISKKEAVHLAERERNKAETTLKMYEISSTIPGVVTAVFKKPGEAVKSAPSYEPIFQIQNLSRLRAEGLVGVQHLPRLRRGIKRVVIEASEAESPEQILIGHLQEVTSVAIGAASKKDSNQLFIISGSADGTVRVWDRGLRSEVCIMHHPSPVRAVACTPSGASSHWCLSGAEDGVARLWDLDALRDKPVHELAGAHRRAITCVAFSPDGRFCATGGDDHEIYLWEAATGAMRYRLPPGHRAGITSVQFLPHAQLVSAGRDNTIRLWTLGEQSARLELTIPRRSGDVTMPGASPDGRRVLVDYGKTLRVLSLPGGFVEGMLQNAGGATNFSTLALFSPDAGLVLTAGVSEGRLQLWRAPGRSGRGSELRQLVSADHSPATCAAFAPDGSFIVTGTRSRQVLLWPVPSPQEIARQLTAKVTLIDGFVESSNHQVRIWAELPNPEGRLLPGTAVTMIVETQ